MRHARTLARDVNEVINERKMSVQWVSSDNVCRYSLSGVRIKGREKGGSGLEGGMGLLITTSSAINIYGRQLSRLEKLIKYSVPGWIGCSFTYDLHPPRIRSVEMK